MQEILVRRRQHPEVQANRKVAAVLVPHLERLGNWNMRAANLSAALLARHMVPVEREATRSQLAGLGTEVYAAFDTFRLETDAIRHSRVEDVRRAYERLLWAIERQGE